MTLSRNLFFGALLLLLLPFYIPRIIWLYRSEPITGEVSFTGKNQTGQFMHTYAVVYFTVNDSAYWFNGPDNMLYEEGTKVPVRYRPSYPPDARLDNFFSVWGDLLVYTGIPFVLFLLLYVHPDIVPYGKRIRIARSKPFLMIEGS